MLFERDSVSRDYSPELAEVRLFRTADFDCSRSGSLRTVFGVRLRLLFAMVSGLHSPRRKA